MCHVRCVTHCDCVDVNVHECVWCVGVCERVRDGNFVSLGLLCLLRVRSVVSLCVLGPCRLLCVVLCSILQDIGSVVCHVCCDVCREFVHVRVHVCACLVCGNVSVCVCVYKVYWPFWWEHP